MSNFSKKNKEKIYNYEDLQNENEIILSEISKLEKLIPDTINQKKISLIKSKFKCLSKQCSIFYSSMNTSLNQSRIKAEKFMQSIESQKSIHDKLCKKKSRIKSQEVIIDNRERE